MRIAICISGQPRAYEKGYEYLKKNLLDKYDCHVYIHTWENPVYDVDKVAKLYAPKGFIAEKYHIDKDFLNKKYTNTPNAKDFPPANAVFQYYSIFQSCLLKIENEIEYSQYDWVVKTRFDYALNGVIPFASLNKDFIYIPDCRKVPSRDFGNDQFAFGSSSVMNKYMSTYYHLENFYNEGYQMNGEEMLRATLRLYGLVGEKLQYVRMNNPFPPGPYNVTPHSLIRDDMDLWKNV